MGHGVGESRPNSVDRRGRDDGLEREGAVEWMGVTGSRQERRACADWVSAESIRARQATVHGGWASVLGGGGGRAAGRRTGVHARWGATGVGQWRVAWTGAA